MPREIVLRNDSSFVKFFDGVATSVKKIWHNISLRANTLVGFQDSLSNLLFRLKQ